MICYEQSFSHYYTFYLCLRDSFLLLTGLLRDLRLHQVPPRKRDIKVSLLHKPSIDDPPLLTRILEVNLPQVSGCSSIQCLRKLTSNRRKRLGTTL
jgi:hypothetical protein